MKVARSLAGAADFGDLLRKLAICVGIDGDRRGALRLWLLSPTREPEPLVQHPPGVDLPPVSATVVSEAVARGSVRVGGATFIALAGTSEAAGVLEVRGRRIVDPALLAQVVAVAGARLEALVAAQRQRELLPNVPLADAANEIQEVISAFAAQAKRLLDHDRLSIYLLTPDGTALERFAVATSPIVRGEGDVLPLEQVGLTRVVRMNEPVVSADFGVDDRIRGLEDSLIARAGFHGLVSVPLRVDGKAFGLLNFVSKTPGFYSEADVAVAQQIADEVSVFLQNLRLQYAVRAAVKREAIAHERNRVAREFHDTLAQTLGRISAHATALSEARGVPALDPLHVHAVALVELSRNALDEVRRAIEDMLPSQLEGGSLGDAIDHELTQFQLSHGISTSLSLVGDPSILPPAMQIAVFRIFSEAANNVRRHAGASSLAVAIRVDDELRMTIQDNGKGLPNHVEKGESRTFGLEGMRERAREIGGRLVISSAGEAGTSVFLHVPRVAHSGNAAVAAASTAEALRTLHEPTTSVLRVVVVDDHPAFREGVRQVIEATRGIRVVAEAGNGRDGLDAVRAKRPDVVLLDLNLPDCSGIDLVREIARLEPTTAIVMMSAFAEEANVGEALRAGARGYISKVASPSALLDAIRTAAGGAIVVSPAVSTTAGNDTETLTERELEILKRLALGKTNAVIAREIHIADKTVERIVATIATKLRAKNRAHAVARAVAKKLIDVRDV